MKGGRGCGRGRGRSDNDATCVGEMYLDWSVSGNFAIFMITFAADNSGRRWDLIPESEFI